LQFEVQHHSQDDDDSRKGAKPQKLKNDDHVPGCWSCFLSLIGFRAQRVLRDFAPLREILFVKCPVQQLVRSSANAAPDGRRCDGSRNRCHNAQLQSYWHNSFELAEFLGFSDRNGSVTPQFGE
jgi:hypothetical protein